MVQGDSIGGAIVGYSGAPETVDIIPPVGEVWLITYFNKDGYGGVFLVDNITGDSINIKGQLINKENIRLFISNNFFMRITSMASATRFFIWNGVQFK